MTQQSFERMSQVDALPIGKPPLIGRLSEREAIVSVVTRSILENRAQVCTVVGNAGVGKSRLVTEVIADLAERVPDMRAWRGNVREAGGLGSALARILRGRFGLSESTDANTQANEVCSQIMDLFGDRRVDEILHVVGTFLGLRFGSTAQPAGGVSRGGDPCGARLPAARVPLAAHQSAHGRVRWQP